MTGDTSASLTNRVSQISASTVLGFAVSGYAYWMYANGQSIIDVPSLMLLGREDTWGPSTVLLISILLFLLSFVMLIIELSMSPEEYARAHGTQSVQNPGGGE